MRSTKKQRTLNSTCSKTPKNGKWMQLRKSMQIPFVGIPNPMLVGKTVKREIDARARMTVPPTVGSEEKAPEVFLGRYLGFRTRYFATGITKLAGYSRCLSVMASTMPKSKKTALATILPPMVLGIAPTTSLPFLVLQV